MYSDKVLCVRTSDGSLHQLHEWFIKLSSPLRRLTCLNPQNGSIVPNPNPPYLSGCITSKTLEAIIEWCSNSKLEGQEKRQWDSMMFEKYESQLPDIAKAARKLKLCELRKSLEKRMIMMEGASKEAMHKLVAKTILYRGGTGKLRNKSSRSSSPRSSRGPSRLRNMVSSSSLET